MLFGLVFREKYTACQLHYNESKKLGKGMAINEYGCKSFVSLILVDVYDNIHTYHTAAYQYTCRIKIMQLISTILNHICISIYTIMIIFHLYS